MSNEITKSQQKAAFVDEMLELANYKCGTCPYTPRDETDKPYKCDICSWSAQVAHGWRAWAARQEAGDE